MVQGRILAAKVPSRVLQFFPFPVSANLELKISCQNAVVAGKCADMEKVASMQALLADNF